MRVGQRDSLRGEKLPENSSFFSQQLRDATRVHRIARIEKRDGLHWRRRSLPERRVQQQVRQDHLNR